MLPGADSPHRADTQLALRTVLSRRNFLWTSFVSATAASVYVCMNGDTSEESLYGKKPAAYEPPMPIHELPVGSSLFNRDLLIDKSRFRLERDDLMRILLTINDRQFMNMNRLMSGSNASPAINDVIRDQGSIRATSEEYGTATIATSTLQEIIRVVGMYLDGPVTVPINAYIHPKPKTLGALKGEGLVSCTLEFARVRDRRERILAKT